MSLSYFRFIEFDLDLILSVCPDPLVNENILILFINAKHLSTYSKYSYIIYIFIVHKSKINTD